MKLKSFGCSFIYGSDLEDDMIDGLLYSGYSQSTWPALIAQKLELDYECHALPGIGNWQILASIVAEAALDDPSIFVINWTFIDRFDYFNSDENWQTLLPGQDDKVSQFYYRNLHSQMRDVMTSIYSVNTAVDLLKERQIPFVMTHMDADMMAEINPNWHDPRYVSYIQRKIRPYLKDFQGKNFLQWSKDQGFPISDRNHPLEQAHRAAADFMLFNWNDYVGS